MENPKGIAKQESNQVMVQERLCYDKLPLAVYREIAAHLQQIAGVTTNLVSQTSPLFDYTQSQIEALEINYPENLSPSEKNLLGEILDYYSQRYGKYSRLGE